MNFFKKHLSKFQSELLYIDFAYLSAKIAQSVKKRIGQIRRKRRLLTAAHLTDTCSLNSKERVQWVSMLMAVGKEHTPSAFSTLPLVEVLFLKSKITEVYANDPEASRKHLILLLESV